jgi:hypothetical protein
MPGFLLTVIMVVAWIVLVANISACFFALMIGKLDKMPGSLLASVVLIAVSACWIWWWGPALAAS